VGGSRLIPGPTAVTPGGLPQRIAFSCGRTATGRTVHGVTLRAATSDGHATSFELGAPVRIASATHQTAAFTTFYTYVSEAFRTLLDRRAPFAYPGGPSPSHWGSGMGPVPAVVFSSSALGWGRWLGVGVGEERRGRARDVGGSFVFFGTATALAGPSSRHGGRGDAAVDKRAALGRASRGGRQQCR
jgi:hypothetical protein